jgi:hypothetical protein
MEAIMRREPPWNPLLEYQLYYFRMYLGASNSAQSQPDGSWFIGSVDGDVREKNWQRLNPYMVATRAVK